MRRLKKKRRLGVVDKETETVQAYLPGKERNVVYRPGKKTNADDQNMIFGLCGEKPNVIVPKEVYGIKFNAS